MQAEGFLGCIGYYRRLIRSYANIACPLNLMIRKDSNFECTLERKKAFDSEGRGRGWLFKQRNRWLLAWGDEFGRVVAALKRGSLSKMKTGDGGTMVELMVEGEGVQNCESLEFPSKPWSPDLELWMEAVIPDLCEMVLGGDLFLTTGGWSSATKPP